MEEKKYVSPNRRDKLWQRFRATGKVEDYLLYSRYEAETAEELAEEEKQKDKE